MTRVRRGEFMALLGGTSAALPQQPGRLWSVFGSETAACRSIVSPRS
jgi:hypothetical protein